MSEDFAPTRRPDRGVARRQAFLQAARTVFLELGYEAASVNDVVRLAGGSLATLYAQFGNKEGLFLAVAAEQHERFVDAMTPRCEDHLPLDQGLRAIGERYLRALLSHDNVCFYRVLIGEGRKFPQLVQQYTEACADRVIEVVAAYLKRAGPDMPSPDIAAAYFLDLLRGRHLFNALADGAAEPTEDDLTAHVNNVVRFFMNAVRT